jgi:ribosomal-protein-alanine N-acetyltransferase
VTIETRAIGPRLFLRELTLDDWADVHAYASMPEVCRFQPWGPNSPADSRRFVEAAITAGKQQPRTRFALAVALIRTSKAIGVGELRVQSADFRVGEIAYVLHPDYWAQGLGTELARLLLRLGFDELKLHRIFATCDPRNIASGRVLQKVGMVHEGRLRENILLRDGWRDSDLYAILETEQGSAQFLGAHR